MKIGLHGGIFTYHCRYDTDKRQHDNKLNTLKLILRKNHRNVLCQGKETKFESYIIFKM
jgi:hypothetical protein